MRVIHSFKDFTDAQLTSELTRLAGCERRSTMEIVACLEEFDRRRLYLGHGYSSLYAYCKEVLHLSEDAAYKRIEVARVSRRYPRLLDMLQTGGLSLTTACLLASRLAPDTADALLGQAAFKSKREVEMLLAARDPQPPVPSVVRRLPDLRPVASVASLPVAPGEFPGAPVPQRPLLASPPPSSRRPIVVPLSESHYKLQVTISAAARERLGQIQDLMRHKLPNGDPAAIVEHALEVLHRELLKQKAAEVAKPRVGRAAVEARGRYIPASIKRAAWRRDEGRCAFAADGGRRCDATIGLEFHHVDPYAHGGKATLANIEMRCRAHNGFEWSRDVGEKYEGAAEAPPA